MSKRKHRRFVRRLETEFSGDGKSYRGISSDLSYNGLFIRTNHAFPPGTDVDILIHLPNGSPAKLKGRVRRALKTTVVSLKNGMGIELIERNADYTNFLDTFSTDRDEASQRSGGQENNEIGKEVPRTDPAEYAIVDCSFCKVKNRVNRARMASGPKCGKCGRPLILQG